MKKKNLILKFFLQISPKFKKAKCQLMLQGDGDNKQYLNK